MATGNQSSMEAGLNISVPADYSLRIHEPVFLGFIAAFLAIAIISAIARTIIRLYHLRTLYTDDYFLFYAVLAGGAAAGVAYSVKDLIYEQIYVGLEWEQPGPDFYDQMLVFEKRIQVCSILIWSSIYAIKLSFLSLFRKLVDRIRTLEILWRIVTVVTIICGLASMPLAFIICPNFTSDYMQYCPIAFQLYREQLYLEVTSTLDILTDLLIISVPVALLRKVQLSLRRKLALGSMLCLSFAMIIMAIIRSSMAALPSNVVDTSWLIFWQGLEAATAVIVVSLTAFRSVFGGPGSRPSKRSKQYRPSNEGGASSDRQHQARYDGLIKSPAPVKVSRVIPRYKGESVLDEEPHIMTTYDVSDKILKDRESKLEMPSSRLEKPFSFEPSYYGPR